MNHNFFKKQKRSDIVAGYLFLTPAIIGFVLFIGGPILISLGLSFFNYNLISSPTFIGGANFTRFFRDPLTHNAFGNTFKFLVILVPVHCGLGLLLAYFVNSTGRFKSFFRSAIYFPSIVTAASVALAWGYMFATDTGLINYYLRRMGLDAVPWLTDSGTVYLTIAIFSFWKFIGTTFLYYFVGFQNVPHAYYEAAQIDGASPFQLFARITLPLISPTVFFVVTTNIINVFQIFDEPFLLTNGGPGTATRTVAFQIYETAFKQMNTGYGAVLAFFLFLILLVITVLQFVGQRKWVTYDYE